ncbi:MAG: hypothetical protein IPK52_11295 [Chloroflexi bacterium]|nr:hypothetical protein [Chloroflexota bacterium]
MRIFVGGRLLNENEQIDYLMRVLGWDESRARQRVSIGLGKIRGDIVRLEPTKPLADPSLSKRPFNFPKPKT